MGEQLYYTYSTIGSGSTTGERIRAQSPGLGLASSERVRALGRYLSYKLPAGADLKTSIEAAPISLILVKTGHDRVLSHRKYTGKDAVGRPGNFFTHAIINPEVASPQTRTVEPISAYDAISLWKSSFWKTSEDQITVKGTQLPSLAPEELSPYLDGQPNFSSDDWQMVADWLPQVFAAFLMLKKLNKTQLYIAAPANSVATFIWCIARCLPHTLTLMQDLTFSTYEYEITKTSVTIAGTCWLPPANHKGAFVPQSDLPATLYQPLPTNSVLAINCYTKRHTPFEIDEQISKFTQFATQSLLQKDLQQIDTILTQAENRGCQEVADFLTLFRIQQEAPTKEMVRDILLHSELWSCLQYPNIQDKLIELIQNLQDTNWQKWWINHGWTQIQRMRQLALKQPQSEAAVALSVFAEEVMGRLYHSLSTDEQGNNEWATYWDQLLQAISSPSTDLALWSTLPRILSRLPYTATYQFWWQQSGKKTAQELYQIASKNSQLHEPPQLTKALGIWFQKCALQMTQAWTKQQDTEMSFWLDILQTIQPPTKGSQDWEELLNDLDRALPQKKYPVDWCKWETYKTLLSTWHIVLAPQQHLLQRWLTVSWTELPRILDISDLPVEWRKCALEERIQQFQAPASVQILSSVVQCSPLIHEVLVQLMQDSNRREQAVTFCTFLLQQGYAQRDALLANILPALFPYPDLINRIAAAASLSAEQLNEFVEDALYKTLTSQPDIPKWLFPHLESYLSNFRLQTLNPDHQEISPAKRDMISNTLDILARRHQTLPEHLRPYVFCWRTIRDFFSRPLFYPNNLRVISKHIKAITLSKTMRQELHQEMIDFLSYHVETESDITRVIDTFSEVFLQSSHHTLPPHVLLLKEMVRFYSKQTQRSYSPRTTFMYIKVVLGETINMEKLKVEDAKLEQFINECLDSLLASIDTNQIKEIQTTLWPFAITKLWEPYKVRYITARPARKTKSTEPAPSPVQNNPVSASSRVYNSSASSSPSSSGSNPQALTLPDPSQAQPSRRQPNAYTPPMNNANQPPPATSDKDQGFLGKRLNKQDYIEDMLKAFNKAFASKRADKIAAAYNDAIDSKLTEDQRIVAKIAKQLIEAYEAYNAHQSADNQENLIHYYTTIFESRYKYLLEYREMKEFIDKFNENLKKQQKKNNTNQPPTTTSDKDKSFLGKMFNRPESFEEDMLKAFNKAFRSRRADKIAAAYNNAIDSKLTEDQRTVAKLAKQLIDAFEAYNAHQSIENQENIIHYYTTVFESKYKYILHYPEMEEFVNKFNKNAVNSKKDKNRPE